LRCALVIRGNTNPIEADESSGRLGVIGEGIKR